MTSTRLRWVVKYTACGPSPTCEDRNIESAEEWGVLKTTAIQWTGWKEDEHKTLPDEFWGAKHLEVRKGDVIVTKAGPRHRVGVSAYIAETRPQLIVSGKMILLRVDDSALDPRYLNWQLATPAPQAYLNACKTGMAEAQMNFANEDLLGMDIKLPPIDEQRRIADFLDAETARIDQLVSLRNLQLEQLSEALHSQAKRASGPKWKRLPLRRVIETVQTGTTPTDLLQPADPDNLPWYTPAALGGTLDLNGADKSIRKGDVDQVPRFPAESILIVGIGESLGKVANLEHEATGNQQLTAIQTKASADRRFVAWRLFAAYDEIRAWAQYSRVRILNNEVLKSFTIPVPPIEEQVKVRIDLDRRLAEFTEFRDAATRFSQLALERRQALITAAVTGEITV